MHHRNRIRPLCPAVWSGRVRAVIRCHGCVHCALLTLTLRIHTNPLTAGLPGLTGPYTAQPFQALWSEGSGKDPGLEEFVHANTSHFLWQNPTTCPNLKDPAWWDYSRHKWSNYSGKESFSLFGSARLSRNSACNHILLINMQHFNLFQHF
jgi:hypothetical protein